MFEKLYYNAIIFYNTYVFSRLPLIRDILIVLVTLGVFISICFLYLKVRPTIVLEPTSRRAQCPDRWTFQDGMCVPAYETKCQPYDPVLYTGTECEIAEACGTSFNGVCS